MDSYFRNLYLFGAGLLKLREVRLKPGWSLWWFFWLYLIDYGANVILLAGQVETISRHAQDHRSGWFWDKLLDVIEKFDEDHGPRSGPPLWGSELPPKWVRIVVPVLWVALCTSVFLTA
jgi:hypothetical protein